MKRTTKGRCAAVLLLIFLLSVIPLCLIAPYSAPSADDFFYLRQTLPVWEETGSVAAVLQAAFEQTVQRFFEWQGNFSFIFLTFLQPASFGESYYGLTAVFILAALILGEWYFLKVLLKDCMNASENTRRIVSFLLLFLTVQYMYEPVEGLYWHPGAISYTFFYGLGLWMNGLTLRMMTRAAGRGCLRCFIPALILAPIVGGSNYSTALVSAMLLFLLTAHAFWRGPRFRFQAVLGLIILAVLTAALLVSIASPGNGLRQQQVGDSSVIKGLILSVVYAAYSMANATTVPVLLAWLFLAPSVWKLARESKWEFSHPFWAMVLLFGLYAALGMPCFYALGFAIPERNINLIYFSYYPVTLCAMFYLMGWLSRRFEGRLPDFHLESLYERRFGTVFAVFCLLFALACGGQITVGKGETGGLAFERMPAGLSAVYSLATGEAQEFHRQMAERANICRSAPGEDIVLPKLTAKPPLLAYTDITEDPADWTNETMAEYYGVSTVRVQSE